MRRRRLAYSNVAATLALIISVIGWTPVGAHVGNQVAHLWNDHIKPKVSDPGTINDSENPVDWTKLKGVPAGFSDGRDYGVETAGFGLGLSTAFGKFFYVNSDQIQRRVTGSCIGDAAVSGIAKDGKVSCNKDNSTHAYTVGDSDTGIICNGYCTEGSLALPAGSYYIVATIGIFQTDPDEDRLWVVCTLTAGNQTEPIHENHMAGSHTVVTFSAVATLSSAGNASLNCRDDDIGDTTGDNLRITALRLSGFN